MIKSKEYLITKSMFRTILLCLILIVTSKHSLSAQALSFINSSSNARELGMGGMVFANAEGVFSMYQNISSLSRDIYDVGVGYSFQKWAPSLINGAGVHVVALNHQVHRGHQIALGFRYAYGAQNVGEGSDGRPLFCPREYSFDLGYSLAIKENWNIGIMMHYLASEEFIIDEKERGSTVAFDVGGTYHINEWIVTTGIRNLGRKISYTTIDSDVPSEFFVGGGYVSEWKSSHQLKGDVSFAYRMQPRDLDGVRSAIGVEYNYARSLYGRAGFAYNEKSFLGGCFGTLGAGVRRWGVALDFAYTVADKGSPWNNGFQASVSWGIYKKRITF